MLRQRVAHVFDLARDSKAFPVAALVILVLVDRRLRLRDLLIEALELRGILRSALVEQQPSAASRIFAGSDRPIGENQEILVG